MEKMDFVHRIGDMVQKFENGLHIERIIRSFDRVKLKEKQHGRFSQTKRFGWLCSGKKVIGFSQNLNEKSTISINRKSSFTIKKTKGKGFDFMDIKIGEILFCYNYRVNNNRDIYLRGGRFGLVFTSKNDSFSPVGL